MDQMETNRKIMKSNFPELKEIQSDEQKDLVQPPIEKPYDESLKKIDLPKVTEEIVKKGNIYTCMEDRKSVRKYKEASLTLEELSYLLWATQGIKEVKGKKRLASFRRVPSGGARHAFETYLVIKNVEELEKGLYRYLALSHQLVLLKEGDFSEEAIDATDGQKFVANAAVFFIWTCIPYRGEWRYNIASHKVMLLDAGHLCQNLYLASESIDCGTVAIAAYHQEKMDRFIDVNGKDEFAIYAAPVGKKK